jgi:purine nucleosidase
VAACLFMALLFLPFLWLDASAAAMYQFVAAPAGIGVLSRHTRFLKPHRRSWQLPLIGYGMTFLLGFGLSVSNENIRTEAAVGGLLCFTLSSSLGWYYTVTAFLGADREGVRGLPGHVITGLLCNTLLTALGLIAGYQTYGAESRAVTPVVPPVDSVVTRPANGKVPVWIDTDPACGTGQTVDVDDCWALLAAARFPTLDVRGISTVFGNMEGPRVDAFARQVVARLFEGSTAGRAEVFPGRTTKGESAWLPTPASRALAAALEREPLTILALGPLTNIATLIQNRPDLLNRIARIVVVAGKQPGQLFHPGRQWWFHFGDFNIAQDPRAAEVVLYSGARVTLVPFDLATNVTITAADLQRLRAGDAPAHWIADVSRPWLAFWERMLGQEGFYPFDVLAVAYIALPEYFTCRTTRARIGFSFYLEPFGMGRDLEVADGLSGPSVVFCSGLERGFKEVLFTSLTGRPAG